MLREVSLRKALQDARDRRARELEDVVVRGQALRRRLRELTDRSLALGTVHARFFAEAPAAPLAPATPVPESPPTPTIHPPGPPRGGPGGGRPAAPGSPPPRGPGGGPPARSASSASRGGPSP